jgi:thiamine-phosphate pyrophosphorylase
MTLPRVYPILDTATLEASAISPIAAAVAMLEGGAQILQFRHKSHWSREVFEQARQIGEFCRSAHALFVVNDRADYASLLNAALHLGQDDLAPEDARKVVGPAALVGFSTHNEEQIEASLNAPIDYVAFGPVFATRSKSRPDPTVGTAILASVRRLTTMPLVAIGGITRENAPACWRAGADSVAVIADLLPSSATEYSIRERMNEWQQLTKR